MFKKIPGNHNYIISLNSEIRKKDGSICDLPIVNNFVSITLYGKEEYLDLSWLALIAHFQVNFKDYYKRITFVNCNPITIKSNSGKIMKIINPIIINKKYRVIPNFPQYAISNAGNIFDIENNKELTGIKIDRNYPRITIYDPDRSYFRRMSVHRLVALAWVPNNDYFEKPIVNHKDGNKFNFHYSNLEWCSYSENTIHAIKSGLTTFNKRYKVRDLKSDTIKEYDSFRKVCTDIGLHENTKFSDRISRKRTNIVNGRYEIKDFNDNTDWLSKEEALIKKNKYTIKILYPDNTEEIFYTIVDVMKRLKIWNISYNIKEIERVALIKYPGIKFDITQNFEEKEVEALNLKTGEVISAVSIKGLSRKLDIGSSTIRVALDNPFQYNCKGYVFRFKSNDPWESSYKKHPNSPKHIRAKNVKTGEEIDFPSIKSVEQAFNATYFLIRSRIENNLLLGDWEIKEI